jgi:hypothetical protein
MTRRWQGGALGVVCHLAHQFRDFRTGLSDTTRWQPALCGAHVHVLAPCRVPLWNADRMTAVVTLSRGAWSCWLVDPVVCARVASVTTVRRGNRII